MAWGPGANGVNTASFHLASPAPRSAAGPGGVNIGFDFNWNNGPAGYTASFIASVSGTGATLNNCSGPGLSSSTSTCDFAFSYDIGGVAQTAVASGGTYDTWTPRGAGVQICNENPSESAPLTLFNCFNADSFGQIFMASASGTLTNFTMRMTCLNPAGGALNGLTALIYQVNPSGDGSIPATPLAQVPVDLSSCPTLTSWTGHTFSSADFASIPLNFSGVDVTAGNFYGVYFAGLVPGAPPPGGPPDVTTLTPVPPTLWLGLLGLGAVGLFALWRRRPRGAWLLRANAARDL
jgi:hypothetical protein